MMKIFIPRNISGGWFNMSIQIGPASVSVFQLITVAIGLGIGLGLFNTLFKNGVGRWAAMLISLPILLIFITIAFFKFSELTLIPFIAKMIRTYFLDVTKKFNINRTRPDPIAVSTARFNKTDHDVVIERKQLIIDKKKIDKLNRIID